MDDSDGSNFIKWKPVSHTGVIEVEYMDIALSQT